ncbi:alpha-amylase family glycosyl hydrolase [Seonamhaeicola marinus]|uniref:T9SS type A sorting domain-containing protein n=1 Tax=Seonamhaeicola marinus TaxID=1912246 RepID=A0A5D0HKV3_9FLAO|nr:alpha-amylase family glycosyl hydrolase [Seonamhaeicola marinus]TYA69932.1 T9SS type A sorting domain-containing protein [Seonamhaeicola marinus]
MKKIVFLLLVVTGYVLNAQVSVNPTSFEVDEQITITVDLNSGATNCNGLSSPSKVYMHAGIGDNSNAFGFNVVGNWGQDDGIGEMSNNGDGTWSITLTPETYFGLNATQAANATQIGCVFRNADGSQELKATDCEDFFISVGILNINIVEPWANPVVVSSGNDLDVRTNLTYQGGLAPGSFEIYFNNVLQDSGNGFSTFLGTINNITTAGTVRVVGSPLSAPTESEETTFEVILAPSVVSESMPVGLQEGINYDNADDTKATLVLNAPLKDYVYVVGSFNSYTPGASYLMKKDPTSGKFWLELTGLTSGQVETFQYWVYDSNPVTGSPYIVKTADPFSTLVLSPFDDSGIASTTFPGIGTTYQYPTGQEREVTVLQTGQTAYSWNIANFNKPKKEDLIIYEVLIRDFDSDRNFQDVIDRISYFKNLGINAIELMPIMEFEGNESWGYNTAFHMALDKFYGTSDKFKELVDTCHQNGIAVILDLAFNHAYGRNPMVRMWMDDADGDGWGSPSSENPYFNQTAKHSYSVGYDFNHSQTITQDYVKRVIEYWINEFKIDGFRWDLTKGFTQNCSGSDETCTNNYQADRVQVLKDYADHSWTQDADHYVIFEHLGGDTEEQEWANYRIGEGKGIMMWSEMWHDYTNLAKGESSSINISRIGHTAHGFTGKRTIGYPESHDKDRLMYEMFTFGQTGIQGNLNASLNRMSALGAVFITVPGPKMIWHFAELGMDDSIWTCSNGTVNSDYDGNNDGDCKLDTKPQPQWTENWINDANRSQIYDDWSKLIKLKINADVFEGDYNITTNTQTPRISIYTGNESTSGVTLKNVIVIANFSTSSQNVNPNFPYGGTWYDLMDETGNTTISGGTTSVNLAAGAFKIYGNQSASLSTDDKVFESGLVVYPNPTQNTFKLNKSVNEVTIFNLTGKAVKSFKGDFNEAHAFNISSLPQGIYVGKIKNLNSSQTFKIVKL